MPLRRGTRYATMGGGEGSFSPLSLSPALWLDASDQSTLTMDGAASFASASSQRLSCASNSTLQTGNVNYWYACWIYPTLLDLNLKQIIGNYYTSLAGGGDFSLSYRSDFLRLIVWNSSGWVISSLANMIPVINAWNFYFVYSDSVNLYASLNGGSFVTALSTASAVTSTNPFYIGGNPNLASVDGKIDSCAFGKPSSGWLASNATALRNYLYNGGAGRRSSDFIGSSYYTGGNPSGAVSWWDLDERSGTRKDRIGTNDLTDNNSVGYASGIASGLVQYDGDPIKQWSDKSGNGRHATAASDAKRPTYKTGIQNSKSVIRFDGVDDYYSITGASAFTGSNLTVFSVSKFATGSTQSLLSGTNSLITFNYTGSTAHNFFLGGGSNYGQYAASGGVYFLMSAVYDGSLAAANRISLFRDGASKTLTLFGTIPTETGSITAATIGAYVTGTVQFLNGDVCEMIVYTSSLSTSQRQQVERCLGNKWGITLS